MCNIAKIGLLYFSILFITHLIVQSLESDVSVAPGVYSLGGQTLIRPSQKGITTSRDFCYASPRADCLKLGSEKIKPIFLVYTRERKKP